MRAPMVIIRGPRRGRQRIGVTKMRTCHQISYQSRVQSSWLWAVSLLAFSSVR